MNMTLAEIYKGNQIGTKYNSEKANNNKKLIDEIYNNSEYFDLQETGIHYLCRIKSVILMHD